MATQPEKMDRVAFYFMMAMLVIGLMILAGLAITPLIMELFEH
jgi:hypothetical protein